MRTTPRALVVSVVAVIAFLAQGCDLKPPSGDDGFLRLGGLARADSIRAASPEEAVRLYLLTARRITPFDVRARDVIGRRGAATSGYLLGELASSINDLDKWACVVALARADEINDGLVSRDSASMRVLEVAVGKMGEGFFRSNSQELLGRLRSAR